MNDTDMGLGVAHGLHLELMIRCIELVGSRQRTSLSYVASFVLRLQSQSNGVTRSADRLACTEATASKKATGASFRRRITFREGHQNRGLPAFKIGRSVMFPCDAEVLYQVSQIECRKRDDASLLLTCRGSLDEFARYHPVPARPLRPLYFAAFPDSIPGIVLLHKGLESSASRPGPR